MIFRRRLVALAVMAPATLPDSSLIFAAENRGGFSAGGFCRSFVPIGSSERIGRGLSGVTVPGRVPR